MRAKLMIAAALLGGASSASAQIFWQAPDFRGAPIMPGEVGIGVPLPGATPEEQSASITWQMRSGLNVMALQCQFDRTLLTENTYNTILTNHKTELEAAYAKLAAYFRRMNKTPKAAQDALDRYGTKSYLAMSTVHGQYEFCETASNIAKRAIYAPRGSFTAFAVERLRELRASLIRTGEQQFHFRRPVGLVQYPVLDNKCWRRDAYKTSCGVQI